MSYKNHSVVFEVLIFLFVTLTLSNSAGAQVDYPDDLINPLTDSEINQIHSPLNSPFSYFALADSFSKKKDSSNASKFFLQIDPYYFLQWNILPDSLQKFISKKFRLTKDAIEKYKILFTQAYKSKKSDTYNKFKKMVEEDQNIRNKMDKCKDSTCFSLTDKKMMNTDSVHFDYLYKYILTKGWPTISDGSLYASILAIHDHDHHEAYIPILKKAVLEGQASIWDLRLVNYWFTLKKQYDHLNDYIIKNQYYKFDISSMIDNRMPASLKAIEQRVREHCPVHPLMVLECKNIEKNKAWIDRMFAIDRDKNVLGLLNIDLFNVCSAKKFPMVGGIWTVNWRTAEHEDLKLFLYIPYDKENIVLKKFNKYIKDKKFITHPIHFAENKSAILPEDIDFLKQLVTWLKQNPLTKLELDGHTDKEGSTASNMKLSLARANEVKKKLVASGIDVNRFTIRGFGDTLPLQTNSTPEGKAANRRVEFIILKD